MDSGMAQMMALMMMANTNRGGPGQAQPPRTPEQKAAARARMVNDHEKMFDKLVNQFYGVHDMTALQVSSTADVKPAADFPAPQPLERCAPIDIADLRRGVTHRGRVLRGRLIVKPVTMTGLMTLLEDENGDVVMVALYNFLPGHLKGLAAMRVAAQELPVGQAVAIIEPFYKVMADGSPGVRVDNPKELIKLDALLVGDAVALQADGRAHFTNAQYDQAADCYLRALGRMPDAAGSGSELLLAALLNASLTHHRSGDAARSLQAAAAAVALRPDSSKAYYRSAVALARLKAPLAARVALHSAFGWMPGGGPSGDEWRRMTAELGPLPEAGAPPSRKEAAAGRDEALRLLTSSTALDGVAPVADGVVTAAAGPVGVQNPSDAAAAITAAAAAKEAGNAAFKLERWAEALDGYREATATLAAALPAATLLANLAACHLQRSQPREALAAATAAVLLQPSNAKAHHRRAQAALAIGWAREAAVAVQVGIAAVGPGDGADALRALQERIATAGHVGLDERGGAAASGQGAKNAQARDGAAGRGVHLREREVEAMKGGSAPVESTAMLNALGQMAKLDPKTSANMEKLRREEPLMWMALQKDERVPPFHTEFSKAGRWPPLCDVEQCGRRLWDAYELCVGMGTHLLGMSHLEGCDPVDLFMKRVGCLDGYGAQRIAWITNESTPDGAVSFRAFHGAGYNPTIFHSFANAAAPAVPMPPGYAAGSGTEGGASSAGATRPSTSASSGHIGTRIHVAIGFVDLGTLGAAVSLPEWDEHVEAAVREAVAAAREQAADSGVPTPSQLQQPRAATTLLRWVGYEASPYCVAKTLVLERMMRSGGHMATEHVLQVWYSSVWTRAAAAAFRDALTELLRDVGAGTVALAPEVAAYLRHWQLKDVGLAESRRRWLADWKRTYCIVGMLKEKADRMALAEYLMTGQLPGLDGGELVGSVTMFANPKGGPERSLEECFLQALPQHELFAARMAGGTNGTGARRSARRAEGAGRSSSDRHDLVSAGLGILRRGVRRLAGLLASGRVEVQVVLRCVEPRDAAAAASIALLAPASISWSNVPDYYLPEDFHALAQACSRPASGSAPATVHHMHTMNWSYDVKGSSHIDHLMPYLGVQQGTGGQRRGGERPAAKSPDRPHMPPKELSRRIMALLKDGQHAVREDLARHGGHAAALVLDPPVENPRNVSDFGLIVKHHQAWVDAFFAAGKLRPGPGCKAEVTLRPTFAPLSRTNTTMSLAFAYGNAGQRS